MFKFLLNFVIVICRQKEKHYLQLLKHKLKYQKQVFQNILI
jgi:hypothetical protein